MNLSLPRAEFKEYVFRQMNNLFPDNKTVEPGIANKVFDLAIDRTGFCFKHIDQKGFSKNGDTFLNHLHADQYAMFLWFFSHCAWADAQNEVLANKLYYMNRTLHGLDCSYHTKLPRIFLLVHIVGTVLGKDAEYSDFFFATQGCIVGANKGKYPKIGKGVAMLPHSSIIGDCTIGDRATISINTTVYEKDVPSDTLVYRDNNTGAIIFKKNRPSPYVQPAFNVTL